MGHPKAEKARKSIRYLKQARRCEQYAQRLELKAEGKSKGAHEGLNGSEASEARRHLSREGHVGSKAPKARILCTHKHVIKNARLENI